MIHPERLMPDRHVVLVGAMGCGKTTIGRLLAARIGRRFLDNDETLVARTRAAAAAVVDRDGVDELHRIEADIVVDHLATHLPAVIAAAASVVDDERARQALSGPCLVIWLEGDPVVLARRAGGGSHRPFADDPDEQQRLARTRAANFAAIADLVVDVTTSTPATIVARIIDAFATTNRSSRADARRPSRVSPSPAIDHRIGTERQG